MLNDMQNHYASAIVSLEYYMLCTGTQAVYLPGLVLLAYAWCNDGYKHFHTVQRLT